MQESGSSNKRIAEDEVLSSATSSLVLNSSIKLVEFLFPLARHSNRVDLDVKYDEEPQLIELKVHPELLRV